MLLDDVMSELDGNRRGSLVALLRTAGGQAVITATDLEQVPGGDADDVSQIVVAGGELSSAGDRLRAA
jgi:recombinational DNA repair ATPase RecF